MDAPHPMPQAAAAPDTATSPVTAAPAASAAEARAESTGAELLRRVLRVA